MLKFLFIGGLVAGGLTIGFGVAGYVTIDGHTYHFNTGNPETTTTTATAPTAIRAPVTDGGCLEYTMPDGTCRNCPPSWGDDCLGRNTVQATIPDNWPAYCRVQYNAPAYCPQRGTKEWCTVWPAASGCSVGEPYQPESDVDRFLRHAHALGIHHHQGDGALVAAGSHMCDSVRKGTSVASVVLGNTAVMVQNGVNEKDADAFAWYALDDLCGDALPPGGYCVEGGFWNGTTQECMSDHPTQSRPGATVTLPTSPVVPPGRRGDCAAGDDCHGS